MEQLEVPIGLVNKGDVLRMQRELNALNDYFVGAAHRQGGTSMMLPKTTRLLHQMAEINKVNLLDPADRQALGEALDELLKVAPSLHMSFATEPTPQAVEPILKWLRANISPVVLLEVGVAPAIAAGCIVRGPNKLFDMSLRVYMQQQAHFLNELIAGAVHGR